MNVIGLTGGIASGKSTATNILRKYGYPVVDADVIAREIVAVGEPALKEIEEYFGKEILNSDGSLNRKHLGSIVFSDPNKLKVLNEITHKRINDKIMNKIEVYAKEKEYDVVFLDAALLIEMNMRQLVDEIWLISVDEETQCKRLMDRDGIDLEDAKRRINSQMTLEEKKNFADVIIDNSGTYSELEEKLKIELKRFHS
ncbi:dephospho-CoA kinase [Anaerosolibacter carboniphilus]|uniref:Dephospho-CoA kinase n=1 Tax=Anaerosolibacter carboniphilus TaxID=1417629 RepID=A0A841KSA6_9FIRM|nr:dephospho-CoA kinase [Anaerosolibacter carboniphilus]MBB6214930.1 dephospho-CoA kinase [Anaerosolibacter carboniphilus]